MKYGYVMTHYGSDDKVDRIYWKIVSKTWRLGESEVTKSDRSYATRYEAQEACKDFAKKRHWTIQMVGNLTADDPDGTIACPIIDNRDAAQ